MVQSGECKFLVTAPKSDLCSIHSPALPPRMYSGASIELHFTTSSASSRLERMKVYLAFATAMVIGSTWALFTSSASPISSFCIGHLHSRGIAKFSRNQPDQSKSGPTLRSSNRKQSSLPKLQNTIAPSPELTASKSIGRNTGSRRKPQHTAVNRPRSPSKSISEHEKKSKSPSESSDFVPQTSSDGSEASGKRGKAAQTPTASKYVRIADRPPEEAQKRREQIARANMKRQAKKKAPRKIERSEQAEARLAKQRYHYRKKNGLLDKPERWRPRSSTGQSRDEPSIGKAAALLSTQDEEWLPYGRD